MKLYLLVLSVLILSFLNAQVSIAPGNTYTQDFNSIGTSQTATLPSGWKADNPGSVRTVGNYSSAGTQTTQRAGDNMSSSATNGIYNFAAGDPTTSTERAVGGLSSGSASKSVNVYLFLRNTGTSDITSFNISYKVEKYRNGTNSAGFTIQLYYSTDGSNWTSAGSSFTTSFSANADNNGYPSAPGVTVNVSGTLTVTVPQNGDLYLAWNYSVTSGSTTSNAQALGIDDVSIEAVGSAPPILNATPTSITGLNYTYGNGPSASQTFTVSGSNLSPASENITITAPTNFEISLNGTDFYSTLSLPYSSSTLASTTVYVRLVGGLNVGYYNGNVTISGGGATSIHVSVDGTVSTVNNFAPGDFAVLSVCSNINCQGGANGDDEISFMCFRDINPGDEFIITDNGYQRLYANMWGNSEGTYRIVRTGSTIPAGTVITIRLHNTSPYFEGVYPDNNWSMTNLNFAGTSVVLNSNGDQIFFMQGGTWNKGTSNGSHDATYTPGVFLFAFNTNNVWQDFANSTQHSGLVPGMECFNMMPGVATDFLEYTGPTTPATKREWINRINNSANWTNRIDCSTYFASGNRIHYGQSYTILPGGYAAGIWTGSYNTDWFNCRNWQDLEIPDSLTNVTIPSSGVTYDPTIGAPPTTPVAYTAAYCNNIDIQNGRTLTMNNSASRLDVYGNFNNQGSLNFTNGVINFVSGNDTISGIGLQFYKLGIKKSSASNTVQLQNDIFISNQLDLTRGKVVTGNYKVVVTNTSSSAIVNHSTNSYIVGNLRRYVASTGSYDFPLGSTSYYELGSINLNSSSGLSYIDGYFTTPHVTPINISSLGLTVNGTLLTELLNYGFWTFTPNGGTYNYDITLTSRGHTNEGPTAASHAVIKRANSSVDWVSEGIHNNSDQSMVSGVYVTAKRRSLTAFSDFAIAKANGALPVELTQFDIRKNDDDVTIWWETATETNCDFYRLEKWDGSSLIKSWYVQGQGTTSQISHYEINDSWMPGVFVYKLYQTDYDGTEHFLGARILENKRNPMLHVVQKGNLLSISGLEGKSTIMLLDELGRKLSEIYTTEGQADVTLPSASHVYFLQILSNGQLIYHQLLTPTFNQN